MLKKFFNNFLNKSFIGDYVVDNMPTESMISDKTKNQECSINDAPRSSKMIHEKSLKGASSVSNTSFVLEELDEEFKYNFRFHMCNQNRTDLEGFGLNELDIEKKCLNYETENLQRKKNEETTINKFNVERRSPPVKLHDDHFLAECDSFYPSFSADSSPHVSIADINYASR
jgi:hypothetical protein